MNYKKNISSFVLITFGVVIVILSLYPYWIYGKFSSIGWYDEYFQHIPWWINKSKLNTSDGFLYGYAGGLGGLIGKPSQFISGTKIAVISQNIWMSLFLYKFLALILTFLGFYVFSKKIIKINSFQSFIISLFPLYASIEIYTTPLAGIGWHFSAIIWFAVITSIKFKNNKYSIASIVSYIFLTTTNTSIFFLLPCIFIFYIFLRTSFESNYFNDRKAFVIFVLLAISMTINSLPIFTTLIEIKDYSARLTKVLTNFHQLNDLELLSYLKTKILSIYELFKLNFIRNHHEIMLYTYLVIIFLLLIYKQFSFLAKVIFFSFLLYPVLDIINGILEIPLIGAYRWNILLSLLSFILTVSLIYLEKNIFINKNSKTFLASKAINFALIFYIFSSIVFGIHYLSKSTIYQLNYGGGLGVISEYRELNKMEYTKNKYRFISGDSKTLPALPTFYNLDTFDGAATNFSIRRNYYIAYGMFEKAKNYLHTHHHTFTKFPNGYNLKAFKRANIKFVNFSAPQEENDLIFHSKYLGKVINKNSVLNPLYIYSLESVTPRIFSADKLITTKNSYTEKKFYAELNNLDFLDALASKEDAIEDYNIYFQNKLEIDEVIFSEKNVIVELRKLEDGFLVFNQVFTPKWSARCGDKNIKVIPVNGIMMGVLLKKRDLCKTVVFKYD